MDHVVVDVEIKKTIDETPGGWHSTQLLGVSVAVVYEYQTDRYRVFGDTENDLLQLQSRLLTADRITGFNIWKFDFPVIWQKSRQQWGDEQDPNVTSLKMDLLPKTDDILRRIWQARRLNPDVFTSAHDGWGLDVVACSTIGKRKIGDGARAPIWYQDGNWTRLIEYCVEDVRIERQLGEFIDRYGFVCRDDMKLWLGEWQPEVIQNERSISP